MQHNQEPRHEQSLDRVYETHETQTRAGYPDHIFHSGESGHLAQFHSEDETTVGVQGRCP